MFDLNQAIANWRASLMASGVTNLEVLDELESHLRDDVEQQVRVGFSPEHAFTQSVEHLGQAHTLKREFEKVDGSLLRLLRKLKERIASAMGVAPVPLSNFNANAKRVLQLAEAEAPRFHHDYVGTEHVLLGVLTTRNTTVLDILSRFGVNRDSIVMEIEKVIGMGSPHALPSPIPYTPRARRALLLAAGEANSLKHDYVGAEHILLGLLREGSGVAALVLNRLGVQTKEVRKELVKAIGAKRQPG